MKRRGFLQAFFVLASTATATPLIPTRVAQAIEREAGKHATTPDLPLNTDDLPPLPVVSDCHVEVLDGKGVTIYTWLAPQEMWSKEGDTAVLRGDFRFEFHGNRFDVVEIHDIAINIPFFGTKKLPRAQGLPVKMFGGDTLTIASPEQGLLRME